MKPSLLFSRYALRGVEFRNRIMASPMWQYSGRDFLPTDWRFMHLGRLAAGGSALVMQEGTAVERRGCGSAGDLGIWDDRFIAPLRRITNFIRSFGAVPGIQLLDVKARTFGFVRSCCAWSRRLSPMSSARRSAIDGGLSVRFGLD